MPNLYRITGPEAANKRNINCKKIMHKDIPSPFLASEVTNTAPCSMQVLKMWFHFKAQFHLKKTN